jgi:hypothetical protein
MLMRIGNDRPFPQNDLVYLAFRLTACQVLHRIALAIEASPDDSLPEGTRGFLGDVPMLRPLHVVAQVDLLAEAWSRHHAARVHWATLLDAAVLYSACRESVIEIRDTPRASRYYLREAPRELVVRLDAWSMDRLLRLYRGWWPGFDPSGVRNPLDLEDFPPRLRRPLEEATGRAGLSQDLVRSFAGLLTPAEVRRFLPFLF